MAIKVKKNLVPSSKYKIKCPNMMTAEYVTVHNTANDASAANEIAYMIRNDSQVSYHYAIDDKDVIQGLPINRNGWHCGDGQGAGNRKSIGVEICYSKSGGTRYKNAEALTIKFIAQLLHERKWDINKVKKHQDWSGKYCPHRILAEGRWNTFIKAIETELNRLNKPPKKEELTMEQVKKLQSQIDALNKKLADKLDKPKNLKEPSDWAKKDVEEAVKADITDGSRLRDYATRQEVIVMINRERKL